VLRAKKSNFVACSKNCTFISSTRRSSFVIGQDKFNVSRALCCSRVDTYVKTYLRENDRWLQKRKTRVVRHNCNPEYNQTLRYSACDVLGRSLLVMLWERQKGFEHNQGLGGAEVTLDALKLTQVTEGWYPLFPIQSLGSDSNDSP